MNVSSTSRDRTYVMPLCTRPRVAVCTLIYWRRRPSIISQPTQEHLVSHWHHTNTHIETPMVKEDIAISKAKNDKANKVKKKKYIFYLYVKRLICSICGCWHNTISTKTRRVFCQKNVKDVRILFTPTLFTHSFRLFLHISVCPCGFVRYGCERLEIIQSRQWPAIGSDVR